MLPALLDQPARQDPQDRPARLVRLALLDLLARLDRQARPAQQVRLALPGLLALLAQLDLRDQQALLELQELQVRPVQPAPQGRPVQRALPVCSVLRVFKELAAQGARQAAQDLLARLDRQVLPA